MAKEKLDSNLNEILNEIERRVGKTRSKSDSAWRLEASGKQLRVTGTISAEFGTPIVRVITQSNPILEF